MLHRRADRAFTLVEFVLVFCIIAILAAIAVPNFLEARIRAKVSRSKTDLALLKMAVESYRLETRMYPLNAERGKPSPWDLVAITTPVAYLSELPTDFFDARLDPAGFNYLNGVQANPERGITATNPGFLPGYPAALAWGFGPAGAPANYATAFEPAGAVAMLIYDPTNGSTSQGDIYQRMP